MGGCPECGREFLITLTSLSDGVPERSPDTNARQYFEELTAKADTSASPPAVGDQVADFELPGVGADGIDQFRLSEFTESGPVVLAFYPFDFSPVCTEQLCKFRDLDWLGIESHIDVFGISVDSVYSHQAFREQRDFHFPLLTDRLASVAGAFGVKYDEWEHHPAVCKRAIFGIDQDRTVRYQWHSEDATEQPTIDDLESAIDWAR